MEKKVLLNKIAFLGDYLPRKCGIATFTKDLCTSIATAYPSSQCLVVPVNDTAAGYAYPQEVRFEIAESDLSSYLRAADFLNITDVDILCVEHEFGIYGGKSGSHVLALMQQANMPIVTTLHTILQNPTAEQRRVMNELIRLSTRVITMAQKGREILLNTYNVPASKIDVIPHGIPEISFTNSDRFKDEFGVSGKQVLLTFGLLSPNKGIEYVLEALPAIIEKNPDVVFIVVGQTHPNLLRDEGEQYRLHLKQIAQKLGVQKHVVFFNRFVEFNELLRFIGATDIYITPYLTETQITSGTLAYAFGMGNAVISTPYWHAAELLADGRGSLVPFRDSHAIAESVIKLLGDDDARQQMRKKAYQLGREMVWSNVAHKYMDSFYQAEVDYHRIGGKVAPFRTLDEQSDFLPNLRLDHLFRLSDSTGIFQHASFTVPRFSEGYCTDDNARALILALMLQETGNGSPEISNLISTYLAFINYAFDPKTKRFRNFMNFDRTWVRAQGSEDSHAHAIWALGYCIEHCRQAGMRMLATDLFEHSLACVNDFLFPRAWASVLLGIDEYLTRFDGDRYVSQLRESLTNKLMDLFVANSKKDWLWFEDNLTYANARISHALIRSGDAMQNKAILEVGIKSLKWLISVQTAKKGWFRPIGTNGFYKRGETRAIFDQQPIEAQATISACIAAYRVTDDRYWLQESYRAFDWFLGRNDVGIPLYDQSTGGCHDGLHIDRINQNEGCESTLAYLLSLTELQTVLSASESVYKKGDYK